MSATTACEDVGEGAAGVFVASSFHGIRLLFFGQRLRGASEYIVDRVERVAHEEQRIGEWQNAIAA